jgi:hypothetical protein
MEPNTPLRASFQVKSVAWDMLSIFTVVYSVDKRSAKVEAGSSQGIRLSHTLERRILDRLRRRFGKIGL